MRFNKKTFAALLMMLGAVSGVLLVLMWADLLSSFAFVKPLTESLEGAVLQATNFARYTSAWLFAMLSAAMIGQALTLFTKDKRFNLAALIVTGATIISAIVVCCLAARYCYDAAGDVLASSAAVITAYQAQILGLIALLLLPLANQIIATFTNLTKPAKEEVTEGVIHA